MEIKVLVGWALACGIAHLTATPVRGNNVAVENIALQNQVVDAKTVDVKFDLSWENSWRGSENWDAAWVFVKFRAPGSNDWQHAELSPTSAHHVPAVNSKIDAVPDAKGVFVYRSSGYTGNVSYANMKLRWNYGSNGYTFARGDLVEVSVHAIEMVYIQEGPFYLGSGGNEVSHFYQYSDGSQETNAYLVPSEAAITVGMGNGNLYYPFSSSGGDQFGIVSNNFPKGYAAFYCMKYEISQGQYVDFLNKLTVTQDANRFPNQNGINRHTIEGTTTNRSASAPDRACNFLSWADVAAYKDWAALRPMTELEFEKVCRGPATPIPNEYAWGNTIITNLATPETGVPGSGTETPNPVTANCCYGGVMGGPTRVGIFARASSSRQDAGAGYYGVMELSGNVWERTVTVGNTAGRSFRGTMGDGLLNANGTATNPDWPSSTTAVGAGFRGGMWTHVAPYQRSSDRSLAAYSHSARSNNYGSRAVRTAP